MTNREPEPSEQPYWTRDTSLFEGRFRFFGSDPVLVRGKVHTSQEHYRLRPEERDIEPIQHLKGTRTYVHMKPFVLVPDIRLTIGLYPQPKQYADQEPAIGEVIGVHEQPRMKEIEIGQGQAWYYPQDQTIVLWECLLNPFVQDRPLLEDTNMRDLWQSFARFLRKQCIGAERITTPHHDPAYEVEEYQEFLRSLGYEPVAKAAFGKSIDTS